MENREQTANKIRNGLMDIMKEVWAIEERLLQEGTRIMNIPALITNK